MIYIVMGVSGCGKTTFGSLLADRLNVAFYDADDFHSAQNIAKMSRGIPLTDEDRLPWLNALAGQMPDWERSGGAVLACSALKQCYRDILIGEKPVPYQFIYLKGDYETLLKRLHTRSQHFMKASMLESQLSTLQEPEDAITLPITMQPSSMLALVMQHINPDKVGLSHVE